MAEAQALAHGIQAPDQKRLIEIDQQSPAEIAGQIVEWALVNAGGDSSGDVVE